MKIEELNSSKNVKIFTYIGIALISMFTISSFAQYYSMKLNLTNPLIPKYLVEISTRPFLTQGIALLIEIFLVLILKYLKQNSIALCIVILLIGYYLVSDHYFGGWNTQIK